jgi:hypothetical protein
MTRGRRKPGQVEPRRFGPEDFQFPKGIKYATYATGDAAMKAFEGLLSIGAQAHPPVHLWKKHDKGCDGKSGIACPCPLHKRAGEWLVIWIPQPAEAK